MRYTAVLLMLLLAAIAVDAETGAEERYVEALDASGVNFIYNADTSNVILITTKETEEKAAELEGKKPTGVTVTLVSYQARGRTGPAEISLEEGAIEE